MRVYTCVYIVYRIYKTHLKFFIQNLIIRTIIYTNKKLKFEIKVIIMINKINI